MPSLTRNGEQYPSRPEILCDTRWVGASGIARFSAQILQRLSGVVPLPPGLRLFHPLDPIWLSLAIRRLAPKVYFSPGFNPPLASSRPFVFVIHDLNYIHCPENSDALRRLYFNTLVRSGCSKAARVLTVSQFSRAQIIEWARIPAEQVVNVGAGVGAAFRRTGPRYEPGYPYVLYVGNRLAHKNLARLYAAFASAATDCMLLLTGVADAKTLQLAKEHGIEERVRFAGDITEEELPSFYRGARALVLPSLFEGFGLPVIEAMASGIPVLTSTATSLPEIAGDAALLVDPRSVESIAHGLVRITTEEALRETLIVRGLRRAAEYSWDKTAGAVRDVIKAVA